jgi:S1-C subfamily serine protease
MRLMNMKKTLYVVTVLTLVCLIVSEGFASAQLAVSSNVLQRTFQLKFGNQIGTCFTLDVEGRQYLITARHVVAGIKKEDQIEILNNGKWLPLSVKTFFPSPESVDIAVLVPPVLISPSLPLPPSETAGYYLSQDAYFLGFPYGLSMDAKKLNAGFPFPFVKKGIISAFVDAEGGTQILVLDGLNNPGFSGGPVVLTNLETKQLMVVGVVSSYRFQEDRILEGGKETTLSVRNNSGLLLAYGIKKALDVIKANPVGPLIEKPK